MLAVFAVALALRMGYGLIGLADLDTLTFPDEQQYWAMGQALNQGQPLTDELGFHATRMPVWPGLLSMFAELDHGITAARAMQWLIGALAAVFVCLMGAQIHGRTTGVLAGLIVACDPLLVGSSSLLLTETPFVTVIALLWWVSWPLVGHQEVVPLGAPPAGTDRRQRRTGRWLAVGVISALCVYVRPSSAGLVLAWTGFLLLRGRLRPAAWLGTAAALLIVLTALVPWAWRNHRLTGHWCWLTHRLGISLYDGVGPQADGTSNLGDIKTMPAVAGLDEVAWNKWFRDASFESIRTDPVRIIRLAAVKLARTWSPVLHAREFSASGIRLIIAAWSIPLFGAALAGVVRLRRRPAVWLALLIPALYLSALHSVFVGSVRYRLGALPTLAVLAAMGLVAVVHRLRKQTWAGL